MGVTLDERRRELLEGRNLGYLATLRSDGGAHVVPVWVDVEGDRILLNSAEGRAWLAHLRREPRVTVTIQARDNPYEYLTVRGRVVEEREDPDYRHIDSMARKYMNRDSDPYRRPGEVRVLLVVEPEWSFLFPVDFGVPHPGDLDRPLAS
jgi:PPOX class probable F420-dependent enzyme